MLQITDPHRVLVETGMTACFDSHLFSFELVLGDDEAIVRLSRGTGKDRTRGMAGEHRAPASVAAGFIASVNAVLAREERELGGRFTTQHFAWIAEGEPGSAPLLDIASNDMPREYLEDMVADPRTQPGLAERMRTALSQDSHNRAYAIHMLAQQLAHTLGYGPIRAPAVRVAPR
ncbi:hypothetical protein F2P44_08540 [Massilia sp. CCM 8695]|uniref:Uncharacterized protein n=1 Tax=Massilia frigida TaxID=2609281 RepID=A0ABX0N1Y7_9BURK|nr:hypothetical protein [Massilia frigida]NHZ79323.1 hypothetical protein [Massilia frigida]